MNAFAYLVDTELRRARFKHSAPINSPHEGYAVILEELEEFWQHVMAQSKSRDKEKIKAELIQISAMAQRTAEDIGLMENE